MPFSNAQNMGFSPQGSLKTISKEASYDQTLIKLVLNALLHYPSKWF